MALDSNGAVTCSAAWSMRRTCRCSSASATVTFAIVIGTLIGALSGYIGGWFDNVLMRFMDVLLAFPSLLLSIALVAILRPINREGQRCRRCSRRCLRSASCRFRCMRALCARRCLQSRNRILSSPIARWALRQWRLLFHRILPNSLTPLMVAGHAGDRDRHPGCGGAGFSGSGPAAALSRMGHDAGAWSATVCLMRRIC